LINPGSRGEVTEKIVGALQEVSGHTYEIKYDLYFTDERIIGVLTRPPGEAADYRASTVWQNLILGNSLTKRRERSESIRLAEERRNKHKTMTPSQLAASDQNNFEISYDSVARVEIKSGLLETRLKITPADPVRKTVSFGLSKQQAVELRPLLEKVMSSKFKG
jgi:hypothetical protein